jgi:flagellin-like protein
MNTIRKMKKNAKALSPVVASIILIAVTVAVSIAVAAWMGALVVGQMQTEELKITSVSFDVPAHTITVVANNTGTTPVTINEVWVTPGGQQSTITYTPTSKTAAANSGLSMVITFTSVNGGNYDIKLISAKGNSFTYRASAPS